MEIESFEDAASATESAFSMLSGAGQLNIITAVRLRPMSSAEKQKGYRRIVDMAASEGGNWVRIVNPVALTPSAQYTPQQQSMRPTAAPSSPQRGALSAAEVPHFPPQFTQEFHFDHTFWSFDRNTEGRSVASQSSIYGELGLFTIENALLGYNCSIFAYGQTSAGKTYTMMGSEASTSPGLGDEPSSTTSRRGLIPRICRGLFDRLTEESSLTSDLDYSVHVSYIEIYHERAYDLLAQALATNSSSSTSMAGKGSLKVRESPETGVYVEHANQMRVTSFDDIKVIIDEGNRVRSVAATSANQRSSRSHAVLTLYLKQTTTSTTMIENGAHAAVSSSASKKSKICLVDLAGSERADVAGANGARLREAGSINKSLATLADVISALSRRALSFSHSQYQLYQPQQPQELFVPYRNSILTRLLKESLGGNAKTIMLAAISPCCVHYDESLSTLKYIERAKSVVNVNVRVNAIEESCSSSSGSLDMVESLRREIEELKAQLHPSSVALMPLPSSTWSGPPSVSSTSTASVSTSLKSRTLALQLDEGELDNADKREPLTDNVSLETGELQLAEAASVSVESPLYSASLCFDEKEKAKLEREVAKLKVQLRRKEREFQLHEVTSKALSDKVSAQVLKQQAHVINLLGLHSKFLGMAKLRALGRWRFNVVSSKVLASEPSKPEREVASVPGVDKYVMTDSENNEQDEIRGAVASHSMDLKCSARGRQVDEEDEDPAWSVDDDASEVPVVLKPATKKNSSHSTSLFPKADLKHQRAFSVGGTVQVDVICSSIVTDFFGDTSSSSLLLPTKSSKVPEQVSVKTSKSVTSITYSGDNNQVSPEDPSDDIALEIETDDGEDDARFEDKAAALIDEIIDHEAESNQMHENSDDPDNLLKLDEPDEPSEEDVDVDFEEEDPDDDDEECDAELDSPSGSSSSSKTSQSQRVQSKLARCLDAIDIARKAMGPTVRKLKQLTDKSSLCIGTESGFQVGTGMERQLLIHADKSLAAVNQFVTDLNDSVVSMTALNPSIKVSLYDKFEGLLSDFCLQTLGHVCDGLTSGAAGTCALARGHIEKQIDGFQTEVKELVSLALGSRESSTDTAGLFISSLMELFGLGERIKFAWYAIDQKNRQRMAHFQSQQQWVLMTGRSSEPTDQHHLKVQAIELQAQYDALLARFEAQTSEFAKREEEDRLTLLLSTHKLEQEHETRVSELEKELEASHASITELEERLLAQASHVELLEQELELTAVVRSTNELLLQHHHSGESGEAASLSASLSPSSSIIVKLEEELASALIQINELEANKDSVAAEIRHSSRRNSITEAAEAGAVDGGGAATDTQDAFHETCSTLADREMIEYMERTSEIEKQNNEAISKLNAAMGERRQQQHMSASAFIPAVASDLTIRSLEEGGRSDTAEHVAAVSRLKQELEAALARVDVLENQHLKLMVSLEHQTDTVLHLEEELYEAQERSKQAEDSVGSLQERVNTLECELSAAQELADSLKQDMKDVMSELYVTECKCAQLEASCAELRAFCDANELRAKSLEAQLLENKVEADNRVLASEEAVLAAEERFKELKIANAVLENRCNDLECTQVALAQAQELSSGKSSALTDTENRIAEVMSGKLEVEERHERLLAQQKADAVRLCSLQEHVIEADNRVLNAEQAVFAAEERCKELKTVTALLENRCSELEYVKATAMETEALMSAESASRAEMKQRLQEVTSVKLELEARYKGLLEQQKTDASNLCVVQEQLALAQVHTKELEECSRLREESASETTSHLSDELEAAQLSNTKLIDELTELKSKVGSLQTQLIEREVASVVELSVSSVSRKVKIEHLEAELAASAQQFDDLIVAKQLQDSEVNSLTSELEATLERTLDLETQYVDLHTVYDELKAIHEEAGARCAELESNGVAQLETTASLESQVTELEQLLSDEKFKETELQRQLGDLIAQNAGLEDMIENLEAQVTELKSQVSEELPQQAELKLQLENLTTANAELQSQLAKTSAEKVELQRHTADLKAQQLELQEKCRFFRELSATQKTKVMALSTELRAAYAQYDQLVIEQQEASDLTQSTQISDLESQVRAISSQLQSMEAEKHDLSAANVSYVARIQEMEQECALKTAATIALETEHKEAIASCISLNNNISNLEEQLSSAKRKREQGIVEHLVLVTSLELGLRGAHEQITMLQAAKIQLEQKQTRDAEHRRIQATAATSELELTKKAELIQAEHDTTKRHLAQLQSEFQDLTHSHEQVLAKLQAELVAARSSAEDLEAHEAELAELKQEVESKVAALDDKCASQTLMIQKLEHELESAHAVVKQSEETLDSQTLQLAEVKESFAIANARAYAFETHLQETKALHNDQLEQLREELLDESEAQLTILRHEVEHVSAENAATSAARIFDLERRLSEKCSELDRVSGEIELQMSMASEHLESKLSEASNLAKHWDEQHTAREQEIQALQSDFKAKIALLNAEISEREHETQLLRESLERSQSSHLAEIKQQEVRYKSTVADMRQEIEQIQALAHDWELKYQELNACVSPEAVHKVRAQIEAAKARADEYEATYRFELEDKLQLEFDLASVKKELHVTKQQLVELQCKELELNTKDPSGAALRSQARQNELAAMGREHQELQEKLTQVAKREASVKLLEASANARFEDFQAQHQKRVRELEASAKAEQAQALLRITDLEAQLTKLTQKLVEASSHSDAPSEELIGKLEDASNSEHAQALLHISDLEVQVTDLSQKLVEANCRGDMQGEELLSFRSWSALQELLSTDIDAMNAAGFEEDESGMIGGNGKKKLSSEARRLVLKHLNSLDMWFERAILGKTSSDAGRRERRASLLAILESSDRGFTDLLTSQELTASGIDGHQSEDDDGEYDDGCIDASDAEAVAVELDDLGDELLAMCSVGSIDQQQQHASANYNLDAIFDPNAALHQAQEDVGNTNRRTESTVHHEDAGESSNAKLQAGAAPWSEISRPSTNPFDNYCLDARDGLSEVAQLRYASCNSLLASTNLL